jgi:hypothetical protein
MRTLNKATCPTCAQRSTRRLGARPDGRAEWACACGCRFRIPILVFLRERIDTVTTPEVSKRHE